MFQSRTVEIWVGIFVAAGLAALFMLAMQVSNLTVVGRDHGYDVVARFANVSGLKVRSPVTLAGVRVGRVSNIDVDPEKLDAVVTMTIEAAYDKIPEDTIASILTSGLLGEKYIGLDPGGSEEYLKNKSEIEQTQSSLILEHLIGQFLFKKTVEGDSK